MNIAYLISAHTDAPQLKRLIEALHPDAEFFVHIDRKTDITPFTSLISTPRVHFIQQRVDVVWGTMTEVEYQMNLIREAVLHPLHFHRIFFLSGMDYPLWSTERITAWLEQQQGRELLQGICMDTPQLNTHQRTLYTTRRPFSRCRRGAILTRKMLSLLRFRKKLSFRAGTDTWHLYKGSAWWCISQELATFLLKEYEGNKPLRKYFRDSFCPAETLIQTIAFNSPRWAQRCILTQGQYPGLDALTPLHFIDYHPVIRVLDETDFPRLMESGKMFCRKVVSGKSDRLVKQIETDRQTNKQTNK